MVEEERIKELDKVLTSMAILYDKELSEAALNLYHKLLTPLDIDDIKQSCRQCMVRYKWFPKPAEIIQHARHGYLAIYSDFISIESRAQEQWRKVIEQVRARGLHKGKPKFNDEITNYLLSHQFSWSRLCGMAVEDEHWEQKRFIKAFESVDENKLNQQAIENNPELKKLVNGIGNN